MASTIVSVLPVPGGPNTIYGAPRELQLRILETASFCSAFVIIFGLKKLELNYSLSFVIGEILRLHY